MSRSSEFSPDLETPESLSSNPTGDAAQAQVRHSYPASPRPHLFGGGRRGGEPPPAEPGVVRPSDILTPEDYRRLRWGTTEKGVYGGLVGGVGTTLLVRQFWPQRPTRNTLTLVFFLSAMSATYFASSRYLLGEIGKIRAKAESMSVPRELRAKDEVGSSTIPDALESQSQVPFIDVDNKWSGLRQGKTEELRDPFFRPGVPRKEV